MPDPAPPAGPVSGPVSGPDSGPGSGPVLVTGISGFIAKHIALDLLAAGYTVRGTLRRLDRAAEVREALAPHLPPDAMDRLSFAQADLTTDAGWPEAVAGAQAVFHTASPFPIRQPKDPQSLIRPAVDGTRRVLTAARDAGVTRVVLTSSVVAVIDQAKPGPQDETNWSDDTRPPASAYGASKTLAERAAWDFARANGLHLTTINPGFVLGPPLDRHYGSSVGVILRFLQGRDPMVPDFGLPAVDVRDVARMHRLALERPAAIGQRLIASAGWIGFPQIARRLKDAYPDRRIATRIAPKAILRLIALFDAEVRSILPDVGLRRDLSNARARDVLGMTFIPPDQAALATAEWLVRHGA